MHGPEAADPGERAPRLDVQPVPGRLGQSVGHVVVAGREDVLGRVPVGRAARRGQQPEYERDDADRDGSDPRTPARSVESAASPVDSTRSACFVGAGHEHGGVVEGHGSGYRAGPWRSRIPDAVRAGGQHPTVGSRIEGSVPGTGRRYPRGRGRRPACVAPGRQLENDRGPAFTPGRRGLFDG